MSGSRDVETGAGSAAGFPPLAARAGGMGRWRAEDDGSVENSDEALCRRVAERDEAAFDLLVERYRERAWRLAWSILRDAEAARDVSQDAFIRLYEAAGSFAGRARFSTAPRQPLPGPPPPQPLVAALGARRGRGARR